MKLFYAAGTCSIGIHLLLEEIGKPYESVRLDIRAGDTQKPPFIDVNPKGKVPTLQRDDGSVITEYPVIAHWLAKSNPQASLLPAGEAAELAAESATDFCVSTIHMQGFGRLFRPGNFAPSESDHEAVKARGRDLVGKGYAVMADALGSKEWIAGDYSFADSALFYVEYWGAKRMQIALPGPLAAHFERMLARPATQRMLEQEGLQA